MIMVSLHLDKLFEHQYCQIQRQEKHPPTDKAPWMLLSGHFDWNLEETPQEFVQSLCVIFQVYG